MFGLGKKRKPGIQLDSKKLAELSEQQLYLLLPGDKWDRLNKASRLAVLQEVENRRAKLDGRPPITILEGDRKEFEDPSSLGYYNDTQRVIRINHLFLEGNSPHHTPFGALDVVLHEGRHAMQHEVIREHPDKVAKQVFLEWLSTTAYYFSPSGQGVPKDAAILRFVQYAMQAIEVDARRFARQQLIEVHEALATQGVNTREVEAQIIKNVNEEYAFILLLQDTLTMEKLDELEKMVLQRMRERYPDIDTSRLRLFEHARMILKAPRIDRLENPAELIFYLDMMEEEKLDKVADRALNRVDDRAACRVADRIAGFRPGGL